MLNKRGCGILLHPTSLPGPGGIGSLGADARRFIDLLYDMGMSYWQVLPLTPPACGNSPYSAFTAFGGNPLLIDLERIASEGDLADAPSAASILKTVSISLPSPGPKWSCCIRPVQPFCPRRRHPARLNSGISATPPPGCMILPFSWL